MERHRKSPSPGPQVVGTKKIVPLHVPALMWLLLTHQFWLNFGKKKFWPLNPPRYPQVRPLGHDPGNGMKIPSDMFYIFHLWEDTKFGLKIFEIDFVIEI